MRTLFTLESHESKRLIAKAVANLPEVTQAMKNNKVAVSGGTTNGYVAEELTGDTLDKEKYTAGIITEGIQCTTPADKRITPLLIENGESRSANLLEEVKEFDADDIFIKGGNALDTDYNVGVLTGNNIGGTVSIYPLLTARGCQLILPVGREKLIPSVIEAANSLGINTIDKRIGMSCGMLPITYGKVITEIEAFKILFDVKATQVAAGGVGGSQGSCTFTVEGTETEVEKAFSLVKEIKQEPELGGEKSACSECGNPCDK